MGDRDVARNPLPRKLTCSHSDGSTLTAASHLTAQTLNAAALGIKSLTQTSGGAHSIQHRDCVHFQFICHSPSHVAFPHLRMQLRQGAPNLSGLPRPCHTSAFPCKVSTQRTFSLQHWAGASVFSGSPRTPSFSSEGTLHVCLGRHWPHS